MSLICPYCQHDHVEEVAENLEAWVCEGPYDTSCADCGEWFTVITQCTYSFKTEKA